MANGQIDSVLQQLRKLVAERAGRGTDRELLERFVRHRDEEAFAALVQRHGPMVLGVCRRVLRNQHDAEDACQATFLVLARRAGSVRNRDALGSFLHGVAYRAAASLRRRLARRRALEGPEADVPQPEPADVTWREVRGIFDEELRRLPARFQAPLLLCYLEGKTRDEAAQELGWSVGTLRGRLERGRELLRGRLTRRGVTLSAALLGALLSERVATAAVPATLVVQILRTATGPGASPVPGQVALVVEEVSRAMFLSRVRIVAAVAVAVSLVGLGVALRVGGALVAAPQPVAAAQAGGGDAAPPAGDPAGPHDDAPAGGGKADEADESAGLTREAAASRENLKQLALAMHNYADAWGSFPPPAIYAGALAPGFMGEGAAGPVPAGGPAVPGGGEAGGGGAPEPMPPAAGPSMGAGSGAPTRIPSGSGMRGGMGMGSMMGGPPGGREARALLSWRVAILPYLGENELFRRFRLDEPWDGPNNRKLLERMPKVFAAPGAQTRQPFTTFYQVFVGPGAAFEKHQAMRIANITDGTSNTLLIVEAAGAVPWTKPEDLHFAEDEPLPELGGPYPGIFNAAMADGSVHAFLKNANPDVLRAAITRDAGEVADLDKIHAPTSRREAELRQRNERLKEDLQREEEQLRKLRREREALRGAPEDPRVDQLEKDNARLAEALQQSRKEADRLREEIGRLKQAHEKRPDERSRR